MRSDGATPAWEFEKDDRKVAINATGGAVFSDDELLIEAATADWVSAISWRTKSLRRSPPAILKGVLEDWCT